MQLSIIPQSFQVLAPILISRTTIPAAPALVSKGQLSCSAVLAAGLAVILVLQPPEPTAPQTPPGSLLPSSGSLTSPSWLMM